MYAEHAPIRPHLDHSALRALARERLHRDIPDTLIDPKSGRPLGPSDYELNPELSAFLATLPPPREAAVLVPIILRDDLSVLFTQRGDTLPAHAGQISFPGGTIDAGDGSALETALREASEEIGLAASSIEPLGYLDAYRTGTGFRITPVVGLVQADYSLTLNAAEVADVFEVPLAFLLDPANHERHSRHFNGFERHFYAMTFGSHYIWGATAGIIRNMHERFFAP